MITLFSFLFFYFLMILNAGFGGELAWLGWYNVCMYA